MRTRRAKLIRRGIKIARTHLTNEIILEKYASKGDKMAKRLLDYLKTQRTSTWHLRQGDHRHHGLVKKSFDEYTKRHRK